MHAQNEELTQHLFRVFYQQEVSYKTYNWSTKHALFMSTLQNFPILI